MIAKNIITGMVVGIVFNLIGVLLYVLALSDYGIEETLRNAANQGILGSIIALGALLNFVPFFLFLNRKMLFKARGVIIASLLSAITMAVLKFI
ncbi:hypothetical protein GCM10009117_16700 [Gangjinia marincola]|uniref:Uncharacterized protein n=1 Tax=Gangjinia marincola TaxID=578463 RepID=A0ABN1MH75_9FLAO